MERPGTFHLAITFGLLVFLSMTFLLLSQAGISPVLAFGWTVVAGCIAIWLISFLDWTSRFIAQLALSIAVITTLLCILGAAGALQHVVQYCGDSVCTARECVNGCVNDCSPEQCQDGYCQESFENCMSSDCACKGLEVCRPGRANTSVVGCTEVTCGDGYCDSEYEDQYNCCYDCGCQRGFTCERNICFFEPPRVGFTPYIAAQELSVTTLAANPSLTDSTGRMTPFLALIVRNDVSVARNVVVKAEVPNYLYTQKNLGAVQPGSEQEVVWYLKSQTSLLNVTEHVRTNVTITITYEDTQGVEHQSQRAYPFTLLPRNTLDRYGTTMFFVTPSDIVTLSRTPEGIWNELSERVIVTPHTGVQFPKETLMNGYGSATDVALLLISAYMNASLRPALVESDQGIFVRVLTKDRYVMIDPSQLGNSTFNEAIVNYPGYAVLEPREVWKQRNATILSLT